MYRNICIVAGARPNFVKLAPLVRAIAKNPMLSYRLIYTGSADDPTLEPSLFDDLEMPIPDVFLNVTCTSLNEITSRVMASFDEFLNQNSVDVVIVVDDLASTMAAAIVTKKRGITLAHLVAGTRSFDINMPKEINRLVIDALSDFLFTAGTKTNSVAVREQMESSQTFMVGNILMDTLRYNRSRLVQPVIPNFSPSTTPYLLFTLNRHALINNEQLLTSFIIEIAESGLPVIAPLRQEAAEVVSRVAHSGRIIITPPLSYLEFGWLSAHAKGIVTDSGNVAEEATFNGVPCITLNNYTEHQETINPGTNVLVGNSIDLLRQYLSDLRDNKWKQCALPNLWDGRTADRIVQILTQ